jgi:hypothetical protein
VLTLLDVIRVDGVFLGFFVPAGTTEVVVEYRDALWLGSLGASAAGILLLGWLARRNRLSGGEVMPGPDAEPEYLKTSR